MNMSKTPTSRTLHLLATNRYTFSLRHQVFHVYIYMIQPRYLAIKRSVETARHVRIPTPGKRSAILRIASTSTPRYLHSQGTAANDVAETVISTAPSPSLLLGAFVGLPLTLWVYKVSSSFHNQLSQSYALTTSYPIRYAQSA
jgi:hypothetical protein